MGIIQTARNGLRFLENLISDRDYPERVDALVANQVTLDFLRSINCRSIAEIGVYEGETSLGFAKYLNGRGELHIFDFEDRIAAVMRRLRSAGYTNAIGHGNSHKELDSYNWSLMKILKSTPELRFDYVFLDGAHTWNIDALAFVLVDKLLQPGGFLDFDDYDWTLSRSPSLRPGVFPKTVVRYTEEQIDTPQVKLVVDLLVRPDRRYKEVVANKIFQKVAES